ncbi:MAG: Crp/Fnr family transcriptional regulator, partial [Bacteroidetes bacterium]|nr:Crp/Fnr family transcriptional regulator [Bacteroidota bacterium]
ENINQIVSLTTELKSSIEKAFSTLKIPKGNFWVKQGKICDQVGFVLSGRLRNY